jgi:transcriptional regulator
MYIPPHFSFTAYAETVAFMQRYNFAAIVSQVNDEPFATHLPFVVEQNSEGHVKLLAHFAKKNPQWESLEGQTALVIFAEPHAYISPGLYEKQLNVPTWNYVAAHAYGQARLIHDEAETFQLLEKQMKAFEREYVAQWSELPQDYKNAMAKGIVAFEIPVTKLEAKRKLSQNKTERERQNVMQHLLQNEDGSARAIGEMMKL